MKLQNHLSKLSILLREEEKNNRRWAKNNIKTFIVCLIWKEEMKEN